jgi:acyl-CoA thioesterase-1
LYRRHFIAAASLAGVAGLLGPWNPAAWAQTTAPAAPQTLLIMGDSLSAEYGLKRGEGWVSLLEQRLGKEKIPTRIVNASISGETTSGGRSRLDALLKQNRPNVVAIELGANDALRGLPVAQTESNLSAMVKAVQSTGAKVLIIGIQVPPNYGMDYLNRFSKIFTDVAASTKAPVVPFFLRGVADGPDAATLFQADRIHPIASAHPRMLDNVWPELRKLLK